jgi:hypothetical protein
MFIVGGGLNRHCHGYINTNIRCYINKHFIPLDCSHVLYLCL